MKAARRDPLKVVKDTITFATVYVLTVKGPATLIAMSHSETLSRGLLSFPFSFPTVALLLPWFFPVSSRSGLVNKRIEGNTIPYHESFQVQGGGIISHPIEAKEKKYDRDTKTRSNLRTKRNSTTGACRKPRRC